MSDNILSVTNLEKNFGLKRLMSGITFGLDRGDKIGLIGDNGTGKSTLLKMIAQKEPYDGGSIAIRQNIKVDYLQQVPTFPEGMLVKEALALPLQPLIKAIERYHNALVTLDEDTDALFHTIELLGGFDWEHKIEHAAQELDLNDLEAPIATLSGGYQKRVALACMWLNQADLLLLDEPTNHLDAYTVDWLEQWLTQTSAAAILVTHDRYFLETVVTRMSELRQGQLRTYTGNYSDYLEARALEEETQEATRDKRLNLLKSELEWARRSPKARSTKSKSRLDRLDDTKKEIKQLESTKTVTTLNFEQSQRLGNIIITFDNVSKSFNSEKILIKDFTWRLKAGERYGIVGYNGVGKTTLLRLALNEIQPDSGNVVLGKNTQIAYFDQHRQTVDIERSLRDNIAPKGGDTLVTQNGSVHVHSYLARFGFRPEMFAMSAGMLSGGERNRLAMAQFLLQDANVLLLDEPTNDLDLLTLNVLEEALLKFKGCMLIVSHDRYFLDKVCTGIIAFDKNGDLSIYHGSYTDFVATQKPRSPKAKTKTAPVVKEPKIKKGLTYAEQQELTSLEPTIETLEQEILHLESAMNDPEVWGKKNAKGIELERILSDTREKLTSLTKRWEELVSRL